MGGDAPAAPRSAATVVLLRERADAGAPFDVLFVKRHARSGFMANAYVFPGGRVDDADSGPALVERLDGVDVERLAARMVGVADDRLALAHLVAAIRETFEEAFVLLARHADGRPVDLTDRDQHERWAGWRDKLNAGEVTFEEIVVTEDLVLHGDAMGYFDHWITPNFEPRRYDTRFFLAVAPAGQTGAHDGRETTESLWRPPADALAEHGAGQFFMAPPQWCILQSLTERTSVAGARRAAAAADVPPCQPHGVKTERGFVLAMPGDPLHPSSLDSEGPPRRVALEDGRWIWG